jgi:hypothetical protein
MVKYIDEKQCGGPPILQAAFDLNLRPSMKVYVMRRRIAREGQDDQVKKIGSADTADTANTGDTDDATLVTSCPLLKGQKLI